MPEKFAKPPLNINMNDVIGTHDIIWLVMDTLRYDVAQEAFEQGLLHTLKTYLPSTGWNMRHTPASFTFPAHQAFFAGFLPTPATPGSHTRLFAAKFTGSTSTAGNTFVYEEASVIEALATRGYHTACIGGVGFFNPQFALGRILPSFFQETYYSPATGTGSKHCVEEQVKIAQRILQSDLENKNRLLLFINIPAMHSPNRMYLPPDHPDSRHANSLAGHKAAFLYTDHALLPLFEALQNRANSGKPCFVMICSDHGTAYGENGYQGHRIAHNVVWNVPYTHFFIS